MIVANPKRIAVHLSSDSGAKAGASLKPRAHAGTRLAAGGGTLLPGLSHDDRRAGPEVRQPSHGRPRSSSGSSMNGPSSASAATGASFEGRRYTEPFQPSRRFLAFRGGPVVPFPPAFRRRRAGFFPAPSSTG